MAVSLLRRFCLINLTGNVGNSSNIHISAISEAARKGTREKARKKKVKVELKKVGFVPRNKRAEARLKAASQRSIEENTNDAIDKVFFAKQFKTIIYPIEDAVKLHRQVNHPTMLNKPSANVNVTIELNMVAEKKTRFMDSFNRIVHLPHPYSTYEDRTVLAFCKTPEQIEEAVNAGADLAGGADIVKKIQTGDLKLSDFKYVVGHPLMLAELVPIRGLLKRKFPVAKSGTLGPDLKGMITKFKQGLQYRCEKNDDVHDLGIVKACIGNLEMSEKQLGENFAALIVDLEEARPKRAGDFITWAWCTSEPSPERIKLDYLRYIQPPEA